jgi:hypothetical protein
MNLSQCPILTAKSAHQRQHELRHEAAQFAACTRAASCCPARPDALR